MSQSPEPHESHVVPITRQAGWIAKPAAQWWIAFGGTGLGIWLSLCTDPIRASTLGFFSAVRQLQFAQPLDVWTLLFWVGATAWAVLLALRLQVEDRATDQRTLDLIRAILRAPDVRVVRNYPIKYFGRAMAATGGFQLAHQPATAQEAAARVRGILTVIAEMAKAFAHADSASYGANVMLVADSSQFHLVSGRLRFIQSPGEVLALSAILYLPEALLVSNLPDGEHRDIPLIALPVSEIDVTPEGYRLAIPGAPTALLGGAPSIFMDTLLLDEECEHLAAGVRRKIQEYFGPTGDGRHIRSFASYRIGRDPRNPIGVLNIDSNSICVLGPEQEYYPTFTAMLEPLLAALSPLVLAYSDLAGTALLSGPADGGLPRAPHEQPAVDPSSSNG